MTYKQSERYVKRNLKRRDGVLFAERACELMVPARLRLLELEPEGNRVRIGRQVGIIRPETA